MRLIQGMYEDQCGEYVHVDNPSSPQYPHTDSPN